MIIYLRSTDGNPDSRLQKYLDILSTKAYSILNPDLNPKSDYLKGPIIK